VSLGACTLHSFAYNSRDVVSNRLGYDRTQWLIGGEGGAR